MITEIAIIQLNADSDLGDSASHGSKVIRDSLTQSLTTSGAQFAYYGQSLEHPKTVFIFFNWDTIEDHQSFMSSPLHEGIVANLQTVLNAEEAFTMLHVPFEPSDDPSPALGAHEEVGVTEIVFFHFPSRLTNTDKDVIMESVDKMRPVMKRSEALAVFDGWALEHKLNENGEECKVFVNAVGWVDVDAHMRFQASDDFKQNIHHLMGIQELQQLEMHHAKLYRV